MKELDAIIEEQTLLLMWNGYTEKFLHNGEKDGSYKEHLKSAIQDFLDREGAFVAKETFQVPLLGYFNSGKDKVLFTFSFEYDPLLAEITLKEIEARHNNVPLVVTIEKGSDVWPAEELYNRLKQLSEPVKRATEIERANQFEEIINREVEALKENGYTADNIRINLTNAIRKSQAMPGKGHHFIIKGNHKAEGSPNIIQYRLHYYYHPVGSELHLKSINARLGSMSKTFLGTKHYPIPPAPDIYNYLLNECKTLSAKKIIQFQQSPTGFNKGKKK
jgi:hypothetical protein